MNRKKLNKIVADFSFISLMVGAGLYLGIGHVARNNDLRKLGERLLGNGYEIHSLMKRMHTPALSRNEFIDNQFLILKVLMILEGRR